MGQKVHPESMRVGYIHDWKSTWFNEREFSDYLLEDIHIRDHIEDKLAHAGLSDITIKKNANEVEVNIHTARPGIVIGKSGSEVDALRRELHKHDQQGRQGQHPRDQAPRARREARRAVDRRAAPEPRGLPPRDEALAHLRHALRRQGREGPGLRPPRRRRDGAHRGLLRRPRAAAHAARRHRLRLLRGEDHLRPHRREGVDQQGRDHAQGLRAGPDRARGAQQASGRPRRRARRWPRRPRRRRPVAGGGGRGGRAAAVGGRGGGGGGGGGPRGGGPPRSGEVADAAAEASQAPQAAPRPQARLRQGRHARRVRRVRAEGARPRLGHQPPDRGRPNRHDPQDQARRQGLDQHLPGQARDTQKPAETRMGSGKGNARGLGRRGQARPRDVRARPACRRTLAREAMRLAGHKLPVKTKFVLREGAGSSEGASRCTTWTTRSWSSSSATRARSCSTCASSTRPASSRTRRG